MQSGFTQNWFFKNDEIEEDASTSRKSSKEEPLTLLTDDNASFQTFGTSGTEAAATSGLNPKGFAGALENEKRKRKRELREANFMAPQNL